jgi:hypothetical protein
MKLTWQNVYDYKISTCAPRASMKLAAQAGYKYFLWNDDRIYEIVPDGDTSIDCVDTGFTVKYLEMKEMSKAETMIQGKLKEMLEIEKKIHDDAIRQNYEGIIRKAAYALRNRQKTITIEGVEGIVHPDLIKLATEDGFTCNYVAKKTGDQKKGWVFSW